MVSMQLHGYDRESIRALVQDIRDWRAGTPSRGCDARLVAAAATVCLQDPSIRHRVHSAALREETDRNAMARSLVASLFLGREGEDSVLARAMGEAVNSDQAAAFNRFRGVVRQTVSQELFLRWPETDPNAHRLHRLLRQALHNDPRFCCFPIDDPLYVGMAGAIDHRQDAEPWTETELLALVVPVLGVRRKLEEQVCLILQAIRDVEHKQAAIPRELLFDVMRAAERDISLDWWVAQPDPLTENTPLHLAAQRAAEQVRRELPTQLDRKRSRNNGDHALALVYAQAIDRLLADLIETGDTCNYWQYLRQFLSDSTPDRYRTKYRSFDDPAHCAKERFFVLLRYFYGESVGKDDGLPLLHYEDSRERHVGDGRKRSARVQPAPGMNMVERGSTGDT